MKYLLLLCFVCLCFLLHAQQSSVPLLERKVSIHANNQTIESILSEISVQAGIVFSYNPEAVKSSYKVSVHADNKPVKIVLKTIFDDEVSYKAKNKYVILRKNDPSKKNADSKTLEGYVYDKSGEKLSEASIYDRNLLVSAVTDQYGYFKIEVPVDKPIPSLHISKLGYTDTLVVHTSDMSGNSILEIALNALDTTTHKLRLAERIGKLIPSWLIPKKAKIHSRNLNDSIFRKVQFSLLPMVSTNLFLTGNIENNISLNLTAGYVYGVRKVELGGILNMVRSDASYCQLAGVGNIVGGTSKGFQGAGVFNVSQNVNGVQGAGVWNISSGKSNVQLAGTLNIASESNVQASGVLNTSSKTNIQAAGVLNAALESNVQLAGVLNLAKDVEEIQVAGVLNTARNAKGFQVAGVLNNAFKNSGVQLAGCINHSSGETGIQVSGIVNSAGIVKKLQLSMVNIADSCEGVPIGLFSFVRKGYHKLEFAYDETSIASVAFRTGVKYFHTSFSAGNATNPSIKGVKLFGFGIGTSLGSGNKFLVDIDLSSNSLFSSNSSNFDNQLYKVSVGIDRKITKKLSIAAGLSYNMLICNTANPKYTDTFSRISPYTISNLTLNNGYNMKMWIGGRIGLRLF